eukprot:maker-scaffold_23-snap-gene-1.1-mRNA-1 protein AED:0.04 eAED:0.04 QI:33/0.83/0.85/1/0.66/0.85/7/19/227
MMKSIKQQYEERYYEEKVDIDWEHDHNKNPINPDKFKREIEEFVKGLQLNKEVSFINFRYCPFYAVKTKFTRFIHCFPVIKSIRFENCRFSDENFQNFQQLKILKLKKLVSVLLYWNGLSAKYTNIIFKSLSFNKTNLYIHIIEDVQNKSIVSAIKNYLNTNKRIEKLIYDGYYESKKPIEEDIIELQEIVDSHPSIRGIVYFKRFIKPKGKSNVVKRKLPQLLYNY